MSTKLLLLLFCFMCTTCIAQFNDSVYHYFRFGSTGVINKTNNGNSYVLNNNVAFNIQRKIVGINTAVGWIYGSQQNNPTNNDFGAHGDVDLFKDIHKLYYWGLLNYDKSYSLKINHRLQAGAGIAYTFIDSPFLKIRVSDGILYEEGNLVDPVLGHDEYQIPRNSFRLTYRWNIKDKLIIDGAHFFQPSMLRINDYIVQSTSNLTVKLRKWLGITGAVIYNKVNRTKRENLLITYGLTAEKYF